MCGSLVSMLRLLFSFYSVFISGGDAALVKTVKGEIWLCIIGSTYWLEFDYQNSKSLHNISLIYIMHPNQYLLT